MCVLPLLPLSTFMDSTVRLLSIVRGLEADEFYGLVIVNGDGADHRDVEF